MRTTVDLPPDLHTLARELAHQQNSTMSEVIVECIRKALGIGASRVPQVDTTGPGLPTVTIGRPVTAEDVRSLEDEW